MTKSKTPSSSNTPPDPVFFVDRNLGRRFVEALRAANLIAEWRDDHFSQDTPDEAWLADVAERGWIALTHDATMRHTSVIRDTIIETRARVLLIAAKGLRSEQSFPSICAIRTA